MVLGGQGAGLQGPRGSGVGLQGRKRLCFLPPSQSSYLYRISWFISVEKKLSCGEISVFHVWQLWGNWNFFHMWRNFRCLHMTDVESRKRRHICKIHAIFYALSCGEKLSPNVWGLLLYYLIICRKTLRMRESYYWNDKTRSSSTDSDIAQCLITCIFDSLIKAFMSGVTTGDFNGISPKQG